MKVKNELKRLAVLEGFNSIFFIVVYFINIKMFDSQFTFVVFYPLLCCSIILLQGSIYWVICLKRIDIKNYGVCKTKWVYKIFRLLNFFLILIYPLLLFFSEITTIRLLFGGGLYAFSIIEYINYFYIRLSYPTLEFIERVKKINFTKSRIAKEINT